MVARDVTVLRNRYIDACRKRGFVVVVRTLIREGDLGAVHCPACFDSVYGDAGSSDCPFCFGSGFTGGYHSPVIAWGDITRGSETIKRQQGAGEFVDTTATATLSFSPELWRYDLLRQVFDYDTVGGVIVPRTLGSLYEVQDGITHNSIKGKLEGQQRGETNPDILIYQDFSVRQISDEDIRIKVPFL